MSKNRYKLEERVFELDSRCRHIKVVVSGTVYGCAKVVAGNGHVADKV